MSPCRPAPARPVHRRHSRPNPTDNVAAAQGVVPRQLEFRQNENRINSLQKTGVQVGLGDHLGSVRTKRTRQACEALLAGKLFDDRGNRMSPSWAKKGSKRWRYYVSQAALQSDQNKGGSVIRVPAADVEHRRAG